MIFGRITRDTNIGPEPVSKDEIVEVDEPTFAALKRAQAVVKIDPPEGTEVKKPAPKFKRVKPKQQQEPPNE